MNNYLSRAELDKISEGLLSVYAKENAGRIGLCIDIEHFITSFLKLDIMYASFAEEDAGRVGFLADGETPLLIHSKGRVVPFLFPKDTIVLDQFLLAEKETGRRRFTMAHEAAHHILKRMQPSQSTAHFHTEFDNERAYTKEELAKMFATVEWQADAMGASLLMPVKLVNINLQKAGLSNPVKIYGDMVFGTNDKLLIRQIAKTMGVSYTAFVIRLRDLNMLDFHDISEFVAAELQLGGAH